MSREDDLARVILRDMLGRRGWSHVLASLADEAELQRQRDSICRKDWQDVSKRLTRLVTDLVAIEVSEAEVKRNSQA